MIVRDLQDDLLSITNAVFVDAHATAAVKLIFTTPVAVHSKAIFLVITVVAVFKDKFKIGLKLG